MATIKNFIPLREFKYNPDRLNVMSSGGGTQSNALICMMHAGIIPKSDIIVMSDTEREASNVFEYQRKYIQPLCDDMGVKYEIIPKSRYATYDLYATNGDILPGYFSISNGRDKNGYCTGKKPAFCSDKWKREVVQRYLNEIDEEGNLTGSYCEVSVTNILDNAEYLQDGYVMLSFNLFFTYLAIPK